MTVSTDIKCWALGYRPWNDRLRERGGESKGGPKTTHEHYGWRVLDMLVMLSWGNCTHQNHNGKCRLSSWKAIPAERKNILLKKSKSMAIEKLDLVKVWFFASWTTLIFHFFDFVTVVGSSLLIVSYMLYALFFF